MHNHVIDLFMNSLNSLGIVFGDLGTSPLYVFAAIFKDTPIQNDIDVLGSLSLILYSFLLIVLYKYVLVMLIYDNAGEGGVYSMATLLPKFPNSYFGNFKRYFSIILTIIASSFGMFI